MRPTFDRRLWILLYWYLIIKCIQPTDQQTIKEKAGEQKILELADTNRQQDESRSSLGDYRSAGGYSVNYKSARQQDAYGRDERGSSDHQLQMPRQYRHQEHNARSSGPQVNREKHEPGYKANVQHASDSLNGSLEAHHHRGRHSVTIPPETFLTPLDAHDSAADAANRVDESELQTTTHGYLNKDVLSNNGANESVGSNFYRLEAFRTTTYNDSITRVRRSSFPGGSHSPGAPPTQTNFNSVKTMAAVNETSAELQSRNDIRRDQSVVFSSGDISKSDIRYNHTLLSHSKTSSVPSSSHAVMALLSLPRPQDGTSLISLSSLSRRNSNVSGVNYRRSGRDKSEISQSKLTSSDEQIIIIDDDEVYQRRHLDGDSANLNDYIHDEPRVLPLRPIIRGPYDDEHGEEMSIQYAEQHSEIKLMCEVDLDTTSSIWFKNGQIVDTVDLTSRPTDYRFVKETLGGLTIRNVMLEDDGKWQCKAENANGYEEDARPVKLVVLDRPKAPYLLIDSRRLDAGNIFVPVKENSELSLACISEGGNPKPTLTWEVLLSPGVDRHAQKVAAEVLELEEVKSEKEKDPYKINSGAKSEARLPAVYRAHHNARILCVMEHPTLKMRQNASLLLDVQYTPSFAISRTPGFGYPLREGIEVSLKCDVDSNPPSTPLWQKDDGDTPVPQTGDGFLNFTSIRREHSGWYKCSSRHLNFQYSSIGYYLSVRYDSVDVTSEPDDQEVSVAASHNPNKGQLEVQLGGAVTLQCPQGSLGCWSHLDPVTARLRGLGVGLTSPTGQFSLKDVVYQDAGTYKCIGQSSANKKKLEVLQTVGLYVKGAPTAMAKNATPVAYPGSPLHLSVEFCANPPAYAARWLHGDRVYTPGNQYGSTVLAYGVTDLPTPFCKEARLTYVSMHERVPRTFYFIVSSPGGVAEATFKVNFTLRYKTMTNSVDEEEEELSEPEEIHFPVFGSSSNPLYRAALSLVALIPLCTTFISMNVLLL